MSNAKKKPRLENILKDAHAQTTFHHILEWIVAPKGGVLNLKIIFAPKGGVLNFWIDCCT